MKLDTHKISCDFCAAKKSFKELRQVSLRIDKTSKFQYLFAFMCQECSSKNKKKTIENQNIRSFTGRSKDKNEQSMFDIEEDDNF